MSTVEGVVEASPAAVVAPGDTVVEVNEPVVAEGGGGFAKDFAEATVLNEVEQRINAEFSRVSVPLNSGPRVDDKHVRRYVRGTHEPELEDYYFARFTALRYGLAVLLFKLRSFVVITVTLSTVFNVGLAVGATALCNAYGIYTDLPLTLISAAVVFPTSFGISFNFQRRETTLREAAVLKAVSLSLFLAVRDGPDPSEKQRQAVADVRDSLSVLLTCMRQTMLHNTPSGGSGQVYKAFDDLELRLCVVNECDRAYRNSSLYSRVQQYFRQLLEAWERMRVVHDYRTPSALRAYALVYLFSSSAFLSPLFSKYSHDYGYMAGIYCAIIVSLIFGGLHQIFLNEEDPFDGSGVDDVSLDSLSTMTNFMFDRPRTLRRHRVHVVEKRSVEKKPKKKVVRIRSASTPKMGAPEEKDDMEPEEPQFYNSNFPKNYWAGDADRTTLDRIRTANPKLATKNASAPFLFLDGDSEDE